MAEEEENWMRCRDAEYRRGTGLLCTATSLLYNRHYMGRSVSAEQRSRRCLAGLPTFEFSHVWLFVIEAAGSVPLCAYRPLRFNLLSFFFRLK
jgi:hypothetical protein